MKRWVDLALLTFTSLIITAYIQKTIVLKLSDWFLSVVSDWVVVPGLIMLLAVPVSVFWILRKLGGFRFKDFDLVNSWGNPPAWYAAILAACLFPVLSNRLNGDIFDLRGIWVVWDVPVVLYMLVVFMLVTAGRRFVTKAGNYELNISDQNRDCLKELSENPEKLIKWLEKEEPIESYSEDYFDVTPIANRIADRLLSTPPETISFIGNYGSGKTSALNLTRLKLEQNDILVVSLSAWAFEDGKFIYYVISHMIKTIAKETDCISVSFLPSQFQNTFHQLDLGVFNFVKLFVHTESPEELVKKMNTILLRSNKKVAVFIEDIDRNNSPHILREVCSLFNYFQDRNNISFVITHGGII